MSRISVLQNIRPEYPVDKLLGDGPISPELIRLAEVQLVYAVEGDHLIDVVGATGIAGIRGAFGSARLRDAVSTVLRGFFRESIGDYDKREEILREHFEDIGAIRNEIARDSVTVFREILLGL